MSQQDEMEHQAYPTDESLKTWWTKSLYKLGCHELFIHTGVQIASFAFS